ncbi:hypothetical protein SLS55_010612 [Diplodia seriata]|uniref:Uncharacterized protein n=1 Tax=Diplodia seriata TaxID=420778 RepID=A0ABR3BYD5_9PEZI
MVDSKLKKIIAQAIEDMDDSKLEDGCLLRGEKMTVQVFAYGSPSQSNNDVHVDSERPVMIEDRPSGPYYKVSIQGCMSGTGSIRKSAYARGNTGTQYATVLIHDSFKNGGLPSADVIRDCFRSSSARCDEKAPDNINAFVMTVVIHANGSWINEFTGETGNVPEGVQPPKSEAQMIQEAEEKDGKNKGKKAKGGKKQHGNKHR